MLLMLEKGQHIHAKGNSREAGGDTVRPNDLDFRRGTFRVRGDVIEIYPTYEESAYRIEMWGDEVESLSRIDPCWAKCSRNYERLPIYPKTHYVMSRLTKTRRSNPSKLNWNPGVRNWKSRAS